VAAPPDIAAKKAELDRLRAAPQAASAIVNIAHDLVMHHVAQVRFYHEGTKNSQRRTINKSYFDSPRFKFF